MKHLNSVSAKRIMLKKSICIKLLLTIKLSKKNCYRFNFQCSEPLLPQKLHFANTFFWFGCEYKNFLKSFYAENSTFQSLIRRLVRCRTLNESWCGHQKLSISQLRLSSPKRNQLFWGQLCIHIWILERRTFYVFNAVPVFLQKKPPEVFYTKSCS